MKKFIAIVLTTILSLGIVAPALAGDYRQRQKDEQAARAIVGIGLAIIGGAIIAGNQQRVHRHYVPAPRRHHYQHPLQPRYDSRYNSRRHHDNNRRQSRNGVWVEKWSYERNGRACPGPIDYDNGTWLCRVR